MKTRLLFPLLTLTLALTGAVVQAATPAAAATPRTEVAPVAAPAPAAAASDADNDNDNDSDDNNVNVRVRRQGNAVVSVGRDATLAAGRTADAVVAIGGNATSAGEVRDGVVAVDGDARATGPVGDSVVAVLGNAYLNSTARSVVAIFGNVELGPEARVSREVVAVGGAVTRDPAAVVTGREQIVSVGHLGRMDGLRTWIKRCALLGRPLALDARLGWAWGIALGFLAFYALLALLFRDAVQRCVETMETRPGRSLLAALITVVMSPVVVVLLMITVIGIVLVPFFALAVLAAGLFGKAVMLTWIGRRVYRDEQPLVPLLIGGAIVLLLYLVPILGVLVYKLLGLLGLGVVAYTMLLLFRPEVQSVGVTPGPAVAPGAAFSAAAAAPAAAASSAAFAAASIDNNEEVPVNASNETTHGNIASGPAPVDFSAMPRAGFWPRMAALALDSMMMLVVMSLISNSGPRGVLGLLAIYAAIMWHLKGTTIGGSIVGLKLIRTDGRPIDWATAFVRALGCLLSLAIAGLGFLWIVFDADRQAWHDKIAGTAVVRVPKGVSLL